MATTTAIPSFEDLPLRKGDPPFSAWGLWKDSQLGALNHLTEAVVLRAAKEEIRTGIRVGLKYDLSLEQWAAFARRTEGVTDFCCSLPLDFVNPPLLGRVGFEHKIINKAPKIVNDDVITFNTQGSAQWDSFRHFAYQPEKKFYNGVTQEDIHASPHTTINGIDGWGDRGVAGRGVLIDYYSYARERGNEYDPTGSHQITLDEIKSIITEKGITLRRGDIFFLRTGYVKSYGELDFASREEHKSKYNWPGFAQSEESVKWLWDNQFAAVAADNPAFDCTPGADPKYFLHPILLAGWGTPIGELFDLEKLSEICKKLDRWTFFFSSAPLNYTGVVASPPNALAFF